VYRIRKTEKEARPNKRAVEPDKEERREGVSPTVPPKENN
jgi:hypothetical protein